MTTPMNKADDGVHRLVDMVVEEVSLVDRAANKHRFLIVKRDDAMDDDNTTDTTTTDQSPSSQSRFAVEPPDIRFGLSISNPAGSGSLTISRPAP